MSMSKRERRFMATPIGVLAIVLVTVLALTGSRFSQARAQEASPAAALVATPADTATADAAVAAVNAIFAAHEAGDWAGILALFSENYLQNTFGSTDVAQIAAAVAEEAAAGHILPAKLETADPASAATYDDGRVSIDVVYWQGEYQYVAATWWLVDNGGTWVLDAEELGGLAPEGDTVIISASITDDAAPITFDQRSEIFESEVVIIHLINLTSTMPHEYVLFMVPSAEGSPVAAPADAEPATPTAEEAMAGELVGSITVPAGGEVDFTFVGLEPGTYVLIDPNVPGSTATLTIASLDI